MKVNEIFCSLQGEGFHSGTPAVFIRFSGCNLHCPFCDTQHNDGVEMTEDEIVAEATKYPARMVVITGGEPALQLTASLVDKLHSVDKYIAVETNGTIPLPENVDWITLSPKDSFVGPQGAPVLKSADELKVVFDGVNAPWDYSDINITHRFLQPCDNDSKNTDYYSRNAEVIRSAIEYIKQHTQWRLSLQIHKVLDIR